MDSIVNLIRRQRVHYYYRTYICNSFWRRQKNKIKKILCYKSQWTIKRVTVYLKEMAAPTVIYTRRKQDARYRREYNKKENDKDQKREAFSVAPHAVFAVLIYISGTFFSLYSRVVMATESIVGDGRVPILSILYSPIRITVLSLT